MFQLYLNLRLFIQVRCWSIKAGKTDFETQRLQCLSEEKGSTRGDTDRFWRRMGLGVSGLYHCTALLITFGSVLILFSIVFFCMFTISLNIYTGRK